ncbi:DUF695 domain-containing protein [bacterium]|nr:DUF695 domain-containing protein [bacterium]MBU1994011.1 DUF695 domain-containing protein [bacterium]
MREIYRKLEDGVLVRIEVDLDASALKKTSPWLFSVFIKYDAFNEEMNDYEEFLETKESLIIALEHGKKAKYAGMRVVDGWSELYFYAPSSKELDLIVSKMLGQTSYKHESNVVKDTKWNFYEVQLLPSELEFHHIQSEKIISLLEEEEDEINSPREVEHYAVFDTATQRDRFVDNAQKIGFEFKDEISTEEYDHGVVVVKVHMPTQEEVKKVVEELFAEIKKERGFYEGWSTILIEKEENI